ncbi:hypothetical protein AVEN_137452-1 [Araneus ventricosus]|uniref:Uncharacterized protein n=1 Tax=Araneus ventricosus TaxID=182803 RepID=A0A4Y2JZV9_ARAVE|nr:hypothetical protein AVEN_137452-1 [Araneus ventricosus]
METIKAIISQSGCIIDIINGVDSYSRVNKCSRLRDRLTLLFIANGFFKSFGILWGDHLDHVLSEIMTWGEGILRASQRNSPFGPTWVNVQQAPDTADFQWCCSLGPSGLKPETLPLGHQEPHHLPRTTCTEDLEHWGHEDLPLSTTTDSGTDLATGPPGPCHYGATGDLPLDPPRHRKSLPRSHHSPPDLTTGATGILPPGATRSLTTGLCETLPLATEDLTLGHRTLPPRPSPGTVS